ncbi:MAG: hypothetical protein HIU93_03040 [Acidobacteria bacterium]|nr:hypothetical protein [Acidobacteriota bacterium]MBW4044511.1 hypothetical protein [Acidobacteriota bacterium]
MQAAFTNGKGPKVLYLPNEGDFREESRQVGGRAAFAEMAQDGTIGELLIYSFLADWRSDRNQARCHEALLTHVRSFQPDIIFWQHPSEYPLSSEFIRAIRACGSSPLIAYHEGDPYDRFYKKITPTTKTLYVESDIFWTTGLGMPRRLFSELRVHPHFYYSPSSFDRERFGSEPIDILKLGSKYDAVMFGTIATKWRSLFKQPDSMQRVRLARKFAHLFGDRFAAFGRGWPRKTNSRGPISYGSQAEVIQLSRMSVIWDLYPHSTFYFSDRLPIALGSGVPFITNGRKGLDVVLGRAPGLYLVDTIEDALDVAVYLRGLPIEEIAEIGLAARAWALKNLEARAVFRRAFETCRRQRAKSQQIPENNL